MTLRRKSRLRRDTPKSRAFADKRTDLKRERGLRRTRIKRRSRPASETLRIYGPPERREAVRAMECVVPGCREPAVNAHLTNGGTGRKADACTVANICEGHHTRWDDSIHKLGSVELFDRVHRTDLWAAARAIERAHPTKGEG